MNMPGWGRGAPTHHKAQAGGAWAGGPGRGRADGQPGRTGTLGKLPRGWVRQDRAGKSYMGRGAWHLTETRPGPADTATEAREESRCQAGLGAPAGKQPLNPNPLCYRSDRGGHTSPLLPLNTVYRASGMLV